MTQDQIMEQDRQWLLSLSLPSLLGPRGDVERLEEEGFYKNSHQKTLVLSPVCTTGTEDTAAFLKALGATDKEGCMAKLKALSDHRGFSEDTQKLLQLGRTFSLPMRELPKAYMINGHPFLYDYLKRVMAYEFHWPKVGLKAFDIANYMMLVRVAKGKGWLKDEDYEACLTEIFPKAKAVFEGYKQFGEEATLGRKLFCDYLELIGEGNALTAQKAVLPIAYHSVWRHMPDLKTATTKFS